MISGTNVPLQLQCTKLVCHKPQLKPKHTSHADHAIKQIYYQGMRTGDDFCNKCSFTPSNLEEKKMCLQIFSKNRKRLTVLDVVGQIVPHSRRIWLEGSSSKRLQDYRIQPTKDYSQCSSLRTGFPWFLFLDSDMNIAAAFWAAWWRFICADGSPRERPLQ